MKKTLFLLIALVLWGCNDDLIEEVQPQVEASRSTLSGGEYYYWCDGVKIPLTVNENKLFVLTETAKYESVKSAATRAGGKMPYAAHTMKNGYVSFGTVNSSKSSKLQQSLTSFTLDNADPKAIKMDEVVYVAPYYKTSDGEDLGITNIFLMSLNEGQDIAQFKKLAEEYHLIILGENQYDKSLYYVSCTKESKGNALEMANLLYESGMVDFATPEFLGRIEELTDDTWFDYQWNLSSSFDINYNEAMSAFSFPSIGDIVVAIIDAGIYTPHPDLPLYGSGYNAHNSTNFGVTSPSQLYGDHGTHVAGVIGATTNNGKGIAGVASGVKIMSISYVSQSNANRLGIAPSNFSDVANAIRCAADNDADVINCSWEINQPSPDINNAITYASGSNGRGGKGCVIVFGSGNSGGAVSQPSAAMPSAILTVGATLWGNRWGDSNYGSSLDVVAPGVSIWSTIVPQNGNEYGAGDGTSLAAPHVSGIAALMLSKNPNLTYLEVADIIQKTAQKLPAYFSAGALPTARHNEVGYGLVNAYAAVNQVVNPPAPPTTPTISSELVEEGGGSPDIYAVFSVDTPQTGVTYQWDVNGTIKSTTTPYIAFMSPFKVGLRSGPSPISLTIKCRASSPLGGYSSWSSSVSTFVESLTPVNYRP